MPTLQRRDDSLERRHVRAVVNLRAAFAEFEEVLEAVQRQADSALRSTAARAGIPLDEAMLDNPRAAPLLKAHAKLLDEQLKVEEAHSDWAMAIIRAVRLGVFKRQFRAGRVTLTAPTALKADRAIQAALKWVAMRQHPLGNKEVLRMARRGLVRGVKDPMKKLEL
jgi:hypothetical protein